MEAMLGQDVQEDNPTVVHLTTYLLALDEQYDRQASELRECLRRAEEAKIFSKCSLLKSMPIWQPLRVKRLPWWKLSRWTKTDMPRSWRMPILPQGPSIGRLPWKGRNP
jgi:hypothetical protein